MERNSDSLPEFARWLRRKTKRLDMSGAELARRAKVSPATATRWLNGERQPRVGKHIQNLATALSVHQDEVLEQLDMRDGGADRMSWAVRSLAPIIDEYMWNKESLEMAEEMIRSVGKRSVGMMMVPDIGVEDEE